MLYCSLSGTNDVCTATSSTNEFTATEETYTANNNHYYYSFPTINQEDQCSAFIEWFNTISWVTGKASGSPLEQAQVENQGATR